MIDVNSRGAALLLDRSRAAHPGQLIELALTYPRVTDQRFEILHGHVLGMVVRREGYNPSFDRLYVRFDQPLAESPAVRNEYIRH